MNNFTLHMVLLVFVGISFLGLGKHLGEGEIMWYVLGRIHTILY